MCTTFKVIATRSYASEEAGDLSFTLGQLITVTEAVDANWYRGQYRDVSGVVKSGIFPIARVERYESAIPPRPVKLTVSSPNLRTTAQPITNANVQQFQQSTTAMQPGQQPTHSVASINQDRQSTRDNTGRGNFQGNTLPAASLPSPAGAHGGQFTNTYDDTGINDTRSGNQKRRGKPHSDERVWTRRFYNFWKTLLSDQRKRTARRGENVPDLQSAVQRHPGSREAAERDWNPTLEQLIKRYLVPSLAPDPNGRPPPLAQHVWEKWFKGTEAEGTFAPVDYSHFSMGDILSVPCRTNDLENNTNKRFNLVAIETPIGTFYMPRRLVVVLRKDERALFCLPMHSFNLAGLLSIEMEFRKDYWTVKDQHYSDGEFQNYGNRDPLIARCANKVMHWATVVHLKGDIETPKPQEAVNVGRLDSKSQKKLWKW